MGTFLNAVKNLINSLTAKTGSTASTADMVQLHDDNGTPNGKISLADLASVLGGIRTSLNANSNLNDLIIEGKYCATSEAAASSIMNSPSSSGFILNVYNGSTNAIQQVIPFNGNVIYMRRYQKSNNTWKPWYEFNGTALQ